MEYPRCISEVDLHDDGFNVKDELEFIVSTQRYRQRPWVKKEGAYSPSMLIGCKRALYYNRLGIEPVYRFYHGVQIVMDLGDVIHEMLQERLKGLKGFSAEEHVEYTPLHIRGRLDGVFKENDWVLEIKTVGDASYKTLVKPYKKHLLQVTCYMWCLDIPRCQILYINRSTGQMRVFKLKFDSKLWEEVVELLTEVEGYYKRRVPPPREISRSTCGECRYFHECKPDLDDDNDG